MSKNPVCYCYGYTAEDVERDLRENGRSTILERIVAERKAGNCRCHELHPEGR